MQQEKVNSNPPDIMGQLKPVKRQVPQKLPLKAKLQNLKLI